MTLNVVVKKWGNSMGVIFPREFVKENKIRPNDSVMITLVKEANLSKVFGSLPRKMSGQEMKDEVRRGWN